MELEISQVKEWLDLLGKPTLGVIIFVVLILYREAVIHLFKAVVDLILKR